LTQVIYQRGLAFTYLNFKNLELLSDRRRIDGRQL